MNIFPTEIRTYLEEYSPLAKQEEVYIDQPAIPVPVKGLVDRSLEGHFDENTAVEAQQDEPIEQKLDTAIICTGTNGIMEPSKAHGEADVIGLAPFDEKLSAIENLKNLTASLDSIRSR